ncbi:hypothetical protein [Acinetobacter phage Ab69]|nr:hypothetical protein [Acinetobacter phage Ab69]
MKWVDLLSIRKNMPNWLITIVYLVLLMKN